MEDSVSPSSTRDNLHLFANTEFAYFKLVFGILYLVVGSCCLVVFFRSREVFEIRARSVYLVSTLGLLLLLYVGVSVDLQTIVLFDTPRNYFANNLIVFFLTFSIAGLYISRVVRLALGFSPKLRRSLPMLMSERLLVTLSLCVGVASLSIPIYYKLTITGTNSAERFRENQREVTWFWSLMAQIVQVCLLPVVWYIDDLFHISRELMVIIVVALIQSVFVKLYNDENLGDVASQIINPPNMQLLRNTLLFGLSIIDPIRRLRFSPMAQTSEVVARAAASSSRNRWGRPRRYRGASQVHSAAEPEGGVWNYDKIAMNEEMAGALRAFANRALCQEWVWFLEEVTRYQNEDYTIASPVNGGKAEAFEAITKRFIADGAPDEVILSYKVKKRILYMYNRDARFVACDEISGVFDQAYDEVRYMLDTNILHKFMETDEFRTAAAWTGSVPSKRWCSSICC